MKIIEFLILLPLLSPHTLQVTTIIGGSDLANLHDGLLHLYAHGWRHFEQALDQRVGRLVVSPRVDQQPVVQRLHTDQRCPPCLLRPVCKLGVVIKLEESQTPSCVHSHEKAKASVRPPLTWGTSGGPADTWGCSDGQSALGGGQRQSVCRGGRRSRLQWPPKCLLAPGTPSAVAAFSFISSRTLRRQV